MILNATTFNPADKMKLTQRKILDKDPSGRLRTSYSSFARGFSSAFAIVSSLDEDKSNE